MWYSLETFFFLLLLYWSCISAEGYVWFYHLMPSLQKAVTTSRGAYFSCLLPVSHYQDWALCAPRFEAGRCIYCSICKPFFFSLIIIIIKEVSGCSVLWECFNSISGTFHPLTCLKVSTMTEHCQIPYIRKSNLYPEKTTCWNTFMLFCPGKRCHFCFFWTYHSHWAAKFYLN